ncbi:polysaccharide deacetylase family protein [Glaciimonas immobilis]|uniref:Peptidoglycan/xylan/chitin deacetylase (PgdA/CDA1 family) n=1 Tax=Glaciimonas immobilis TaxID=728004 RepID=A0A840RR51_9BURK|nr:polysaccharide deacetylase family protein [Glaciimonas immobilis]MBB5199622.1 peptidoglycan/xylan/chitin deacetylase (PgdA/CDA1 family) [Glaciimonas immobilis]
MSTLFALPNTIATVNPAHPALAAIAVMTGRGGRFRKALLRMMAVLITGLMALVVTGCAIQPVPMSPQTATALQSQPPIRFLLTFDDGPARPKTDNSTLSILDTLANNPVQPGIKALFFVQTRSSGAGETDFGHSILRREAEEGHLLGFHTATPRHANHRFLSPEKFEQSLNDGISDIVAIQGVAPKLVRPPFWNYDAQTFAAYQQHGMHILLTDLSANDGKIYGFKASLRRRSNMLHMLTEVRARIAAGELPAVDGNIPVVVTFHDINGYTADHMAEYLQILLDCARAVQLPTAAKPFYDNSGAVERAALTRSVRDGSQSPHLPGFWNFFWAWL